jgi:hypothetical protein
LTGLLAAPGLLLAAYDDSRYAAAVAVAADLWGQLLVAEAVLTLEAQFFAALTAAAAADLGASGTLEAAGWRLAAANLLLSPR